MTHGKAAARRIERRARWKLLRAMRGRFGLLLFALVGLILFAPLLIERGWRLELVSLLTAAVLVTGLHAARPGRRVVTLGMALAMADFGVGRVAMAVDARWLLAIEVFFWMVTLVYVGATILDMIFDTSQLSVDTLQAALCVYLLLGLFGAFALAMIDIIIPGSFATSTGARLSWNDGRNVVSFVQIFVFSFASLSGVGGSDVTAATAFAVNAASLEAMVGQIYLAVVVARLVGLQYGPDDEPSA
ncbi:MAG: hypothetical protein U0794_17625 [Isosphaeraceae bacterium]